MLLCPGYVMFVMWLLLICADPFSTPQPIPSGMGYAKRIQNIMPPDIDS